MTGEIYSIKGGDEEGKIMGKKWRKTMEDVGGGLNSGGMRRRKEGGMRLEGEQEIDWCVGVEGRLR